MAHKGRQWPVAFRRDFNLNVPTNNLGWARRYIGYITFMAQGLGGAVSGVEFDCGPDFQSQPNELDWSSEFKRIGLFFYKMELITQINDGLHYFRQVSINVSGHGTILVCDWPPQENPNVPGWPAGFYINVVFWSPDWFDFEPFGVSPTVAPKVWTLPPPH